jgi:hypothetical protein
MHCRLASSFQKQWLTSNISSTKKPDRYGISFRQFKLLVEARHNPREHGKQGHGQTLSYRILQKNGFEEFEI